MSTGVLTAFHPLPRHFPLVVLAWAIFLLLSGCVRSGQLESLGAPEKTLLDRADQLVNEGRFADAEPLYRQLADVKGPTNRKSRIARITGMRKLGANLGDQGRFAEGEQFLRSAAALLEAGPGVDGLEAAEVYTSLGWNLDSQGRSPEAEIFDRRALAIRRKILGDEHWKTALSLSYVAGNIVQQNRFEEAEKLYRQALDQLARAKGADPADLGAAENNFAYLLNTQGRFAEAEPHYRKALQLWRTGRGERHPLTASGYNNVASNLSDQGRYREAEALYRKALEISIAALGENHPQVAARYNNLANALKDQGRGGEFETMLRKAYAIWRSSLGEQHPNVAIASHNLAAYLIETDRSKEAEPFLREAYAIELASLGTTDPATGKTMNLLADLLQRKGHAEEALRLREQVLAVHVTALGKSHPATAEYQLSVASLLNEQDRHKEAEAAGLEAVKIARRAVRSSAGSSALDIAKHQAAELHRLDPIFGNYMTFAWNLSDRDEKQLPRLKSESFLAAQDLLGLAPANEMAQSAARRSVADPALSELIRQDQDLVAAAQSADSKLLEALSKGETEEAKTLQTQYDLAVDQLSGVEARIEREFPKYRELVMPASLTIEETQRTLTDEEGLLLVSATDQVAHIFAVTNSGVHWLWADAKEGLELATRLRCDVDLLTCPVKLREQLLKEDELRPVGDTLPPFDLNAAYKLYSTLLGPFEDDLKAVKRLYVVSTPNFGDLPLSFLVTAKPGSGDKGLRQAKWLSDRFAFTYLPSVSALRLIQPSRSGSTTGFVGYGDPALVGELASFGITAFPGNTASRGALLADPTQLRRLEPLPGTRSELQAMADLFGTDSASITVGEAATERKLRADPRLSTAEVLTFATHALLPDPGHGILEPGLVLTPPEEASSQDDGLLIASEVSDLSLAADWVVLSACNTASPAGATGSSGLSALARSFLYAGAHALLASHWRVSDDATAALTVETLRNWKSKPGITRGEALQKAMHTVRTGKREDGSAIAGWKPEWAHPGAWAPFTHIANNDR